MKTFNKFWFKPKHQVKDKPVVEFELLPLNQRAYLTLRSETAFKRGKVSTTPTGQIDAFYYAVHGWRGLDTPFSEEAKVEAIEGLADVHFGVWMDEITGELIRRAVVGEPEIKNS